MRQESENNCDRKCQSASGAQLRQREVEEDSYETNDCDVNQVIRQSMQAECFEAQDKVNKLHRPHKKIWIRGNQRSETRSKSAIQAIGEYRVVIPVIRVKAEPE